MGSQRVVGVGVEGKEGQNAMDRAVAHVGRPTTIVLAMTMTTAMTMSMTTTRATNGLIHLTFLGKTNIT